MAKVYLEDKVYLTSNSEAKVYFSPKLQTWRPVNDRRYGFHFRPKPNIWPEKNLALGRIPKPNVQMYVKIGGILLSGMI
jgi:hypothetical protein